jgi:A/G-specific adenine glycosylase
MAALQRFKKSHVRALAKWYRENQRDFPWRANPDPYWVWIAEIMSQQTQMATLVPYFHRFIKKFPTVEVLARASEEEVLAAWTGLGYYSRARNIHRAAMRVAKEGYPSTFEGWLDLPGVGPYTAAAVVSQSFGVAEPVWDGNVLRVCSRLEARGDAQSSGFREEMRDSLRKKMKEAGEDVSSSDFNQALMELGATVCTPKAAACGRCPISAACAAHASNSALEYPPPKPRKAVLEVRAKVWVRLRKGRDGLEAWVERRGEERWFGGMWDFSSELGGVERPVIRIADNGERSRGPDSVSGERFTVTESVSGSVTALGEVRHQITHHRIFLSGFAVLERKKTGRINSASGRWISLEDLTSDEPSVPLATTTRKMLRLLMKSLARPSSHARNEEHDQASRRRDENICLNVN